jgi:hypothetical protein
MVQPSRELTYAPDDADRRKHKSDWEDAAPGFLPDVDGYVVGKCPRDPELDAQQLLDEGIRVPGRYPRSPFPERIYNVFKGIPYHAHQKRPGHYHGFPERPSRIPPAIREQLRARAEQRGEGEAYEDWRLQVDRDDPEG